jgi:glycosyltransferase involved in cell wall biosynthesis
MSAYNRFIQRRAASRARVVITVSGHAKRDLVHHLHIPEAKIRVIPNAHGAQFRPDHNEGRIRALRDRYRLPESPIVTLVSASPRKNAAGLLRAYARLTEEVRTKHPLVMVFTHRLLESGLRAQARRLDVAENVCFLPSLPDEDLALLYSNAALFAFPSLYEGFGLPVLEAMACGAPVVASSLSSTPEVAGEAAELVDPRNESQLSQVLARVLSNPERRAALAAAGLERARQYTWKRTARQTLDVYEEVAGFAQRGGARAA